MPKMKVEVAAHNVDQTENVYFETTVTYRKTTMPNFVDAVVKEKAIKKCKTFLKRSYPALLAELTDFDIRNL